MIPDFSCKTGRLSLSTQSISTSTEHEVRIVLPGNEFNNIKLPDLEMVLTAGLVSVDTGNVTQLLSHDHIKTVTLSGTISKSFSVFIPILSFFFILKLRIQSDNYCLLLQCQLF